MAATNRTSDRVPNSNDYYGNPPATARQFFRALYPHIEHGHVSHRDDNQRVVAYTSDDTISELLDVVDEHDYRVVEVEPRKGEYSDTGHIVALVPR